MFIDRLRVELEQDEGCKYHIYLDHLGLPTAGVGHLLKGTDPEYNKSVGTVVSPERVAEWFEQDVQITLNDCKKVFDDWDSMNEESAIRNLKKLSGTEHYQYSGVCIFQNGESLWDYSEYAIMKMHNLSEDEIISYVEKENPIHAAGAYKFESLGCNLFESVDGSSYTVRGMPLLSLLKQLRELDIINLESIEIK